MSLICVVLKKRSLVPITAAFGSFLVSINIGILLGHLPNLFEIINIIDSNQKLPFKFYLYGIGALVLTIFGSIYQILIISKKKTRKYYYDIYAQLRNLP